MRRAFLALLLACLWVGAAFGDHLEVRRAATLKAEPDGDAEIRVRPEIGDYLLLVDEAQTDGYYFARSGTGVEGWIYRTLVRRYAGDPPPGWDDGEAPLALTEYHRSDWRHWVDYDGDGQDTRAEVLIDESLVPVTFTDDRERTVATGEWYCAFTGRTFTLASDVDIDHFVPLENAHRSGGWAWDAARREAYANDRIDPNHLIAVEDNANQSKGSDGPEDWRPPDEDYWCEYARNWQSIKARWGLTMTVEEAEAVREMLETCPD
jgi:hypothetical protein